MFTSPVVASMVDSLFSAISTSFSNVCSGFSSHNLSRMVFFFIEHMNLSFNTWFNCCLKSQLIPNLCILAYHSLIVSFSSCLASSNSILSRYVHVVGENCFLNSVHSSSYVLSFGICGVQVSQHFVGVRPY